MIPYGRQSVTDDDIESVVSVLRSDFLTQGPVVPKFEDVISAYCGSRFAVAATNATSSLHLAAMALGLGPGDSLWTSAITFVASANCARYCGATVGLVDIDSRTVNLCPSALERKLKRAKEKGCLPKILVPVHMAGHSCDMEAIGELASVYGIRVIEDASHAIGGKFQGEPIGSCRYSDVTVFSFHPVKIITTGEGGVAVTNDESVAQRMDLLRSHGITRDQALMDCESDGPWFYQQVALGHNYRMTDIQAALGISQMQRLDEYVMRRNELASRYHRLLRGLPLEILEVQAGTLSSYHLFVVRLKLGSIKRSHKEVFVGLRQRGIGVNLHYIPIYRQPYYRSLGLNADECPQAEAYYHDAITLPLYPTLTYEDQDYVIEALGDLLE